MTRLGRLLLSVIGAISIATAGVAAAAAAPPEPSTNAPAIDAAAPDSALPAGQITTTTTQAPTDCAPKTAATGSQGPEAAQRDPKSGAPTAGSACSPLASASETVSPDVATVSISGTVRNAATFAGLGGITAYACTSICYDTQTDASGTYSIAVPTNTSYMLSFVDGSGTYAGGFWSAGGYTTAWSSANMIDVLTSDVPGKDVLLPLTVHISGTVTNASSVGLGSVTIQACVTVGGFCYYDWTAADGTYSVGVAPNATYDVIFYDNSGAYFNGLHNGVPVIASPVPGIDAILTLIGPWTVTLAASATSVLPGTTVTLTAQTNQDVGSSIFYIDILAGDGSFVGWCKSGTTCAKTVTSATVASRSYTAVVENWNQSDVRATSSSLTVAWVNVGTYYPMTTPGRLLDTRSGIGLSGKLTAGVPGTFQVTGRSDVVIPAAATAVTGNVTVVNSSNSWAVFLGPNPTPAPTTSTINFSRGEVTGNGLTVALSTTGSLSATYISSAGNTTDLVFDVTGYFLPDTLGATYHPMTPARLLDTRSGNGLSGKLLAGVPGTFHVTGRSDVVIPAAATAVTGNVTVVNSSNSWAVFLGPNPTPAPTTSTINFTTGQVKGNSLTVALGPGGTLSATYMSTAGNTTDLVFDVTGYYTPGASGSRFVSIDPVRLLDTRSGNGLSGKLTANTPAPFQIRLRGGVPAEAEAVTGNVTVVNSTNSWAVFLGPDPTPAPTTSTVNFNAGEVKGNGLTVALSPGGGLYATYISTAGNTTDLVLDVTGYFVP